MTERLQRQRTQGWRMPADAIYVGRPSRWGNPYPLAEYRLWYPDTDERGWRTMAASDYRGLIEGRWDGQSDTPLHPSLGEVRERLRGHDLVCWCPLDQPCHADVLLELARG